MVVVVGSEAASSKARPAKLPQLHDRQGLSAHAWYLST